MEEEKVTNMLQPRMRNTHVNGNHSQEEMIKSVKKGIFAVSFGGGQVLHLVSLYLI